MYDPRFFLRLLLHYAECSTLPLRLFFHMGCFGLALAGASSANLATRQLSYEIIAAVADQLAAATFPEAMQLRFLVAECLRRSLPEPYAQLPGVVATFFNEAALVLLDPASHMYPALNQFLLTRPLVDLTDVPMFYATFQAPTSDSREVRRWMFKLLILGVRSESDVELLERRHVVPLVMAYFDSSLASALDRAYCCKLLNTLAELPCFHNYLARSGVHSWLFTAIKKSDDVPSLRTLVSIATKLAAKDGAGTEENSSILAQQHALRVELWHLGDLVLSKCLSLRQFAGSSADGLLDLISDVLTFVLAVRTQGTEQGDSWNFSLLVHLWRCTTAAAAQAGVNIANLEQLFLDVVHTASAASATALFTDASDLIVFVLSLLDGQMVSAIAGDQRRVVWTKALTACKRFAQSSTASSHQQTVRLLLRCYHHIGKVVVEYVDVLQLLNDVSSIILGDSPQPTVEADTSLAAAAEAACRVHERLFQQALDLLDTGHAFDSASSSSSSSSSSLSEWLRTTTRKNFKIMAQQQQKKKRKKKVKSAKKARSKVRARIE